jgi:hypothetical protein
MARYTSKQKLVVQTDDGKFVSAKFYKGEALPFEGVEDGDSVPRPSPKGDCKCIPLGALEDLIKRMDILEGLLVIPEAIDTKQTFIEDQRMDDETYDDAHIRLLERFDYLNHKGKSNPLEGLEYQEFKNLTKGLGKT